MNSILKRRFIAVIGPGGDISDSPICVFAENLGYELACSGFGLVTGGKDGVMEAVSRGFFGYEGDRGPVVGIIPDADYEKANAYCEVVIPTGMGTARNSLVVNTAEAVIALGGGAGTLSELAFAWQKGKRILCVKGFGGWSEQLAGVSIDKRSPQVTIAVNSVEEIIDQLGTK